MRGLRMRQAQNRVRDLHRLLAIGTLRGGRRVQRVEAGGDTGDGAVRSTR
jgi:hypothetical protein